MEKQDFSAKIVNRIRLSDRMSALADLVSPGCRLVDVGCDHGYIPIFLCQTGRIPSAIAMDINEGPLERARQHIEECGLSGSIQTRISDGLEKLGGDEADTILIAGMGGCLMCRILTAGDGIPDSVTELILQPQSDIASVRRCVREIGFRITDEDMVREDGKFYPMMKAERISSGGGESISDSVQEMGDAFGPALLRKRHPVLRQWLEKELLTTVMILERLKEVQSADGDMGNTLSEKSHTQNPGDKVTERFRELLYKKEMIETALACYDDTGVRIS